MIDLEKCTFSGSVWADQAAQFAFAELKIDAIDCRDATEAFGQAVRLEN